jgi:hypothetical protein
VNISEQAILSGLAVKPFVEDKRNIYWPITPRFYTEQHVQIIVKPERIG